MIATIGPTVVTINLGLKKEKKIELSLFFLYLVEYKIHTNILWLHQKIMFQIYREGK